MKEGEDKRESMREDKSKGALERVREEKNCRRVAVCRPIIESVDLSANTTKLTYMGITVG